MQLPDIFGVFSDLGAPSGHRRSIRVPLASILVTFYHFGAPFGNRWAPFGHPWTQFSNLCITFGENPGALGPLLKKNSTNTKNMETWDPT